MTRNWIACGAPAAFLAGLLMVHCSSSTTTSGGGTDGGHPGSSTGTGTGTGHPSSGTGTSPGSSTGTGTGGGQVIYDGGPASDAAAGDKGTECVVPDGGNLCTPGTVSCGDAQCGVPAEVCCDSDTESCQAASAACTGTPIACDEAADCPAGNICCILSTSTTKSSARVFCQPGSVCPVIKGAIAAAQICRSNNECPSHSCQFWDCLGNVIESCVNPVPNSPMLCTVK